MTDPEMVRWIKDLGAVMAKHPDEFEVIGIVNRTWGEGSELTLRTRYPEREDGPNQR